MRWRAQAERVTIVRDDWGVAHVHGPTDADALFGMIFIDSTDLQQQLARSPAWLQSLMTAWADGLNYYLQTHPDVKPEVLTHFEPCMPLAFSEGSIGGDIERISLDSLQSFYGARPTPAMKVGLAPTV